jgi:hypothetical protein
MLLVVVMSCVDGVFCRDGMLWLGYKAVQYYSNVHSSYQRVTALEAGRSGFSKVRHGMWRAV